jgi:hypothetical protein
LWQTYAQILDLTTICHGRTTSFVSSAVVITAFTTNKQAVTPPPASSSNALVLATKAYDSQELPSKNFHPRTSIQELPSKNFYPRTSIQRLS